MLVQASKIAKLQVFTLSNFNIWAWAVFLVFGLFIINLLLTFWWLIGGDIPIYQGFAQQFWSGAIPYRDFPLEYPPGVLPFIVLASPIGYLLGSYKAGYLVLSFLVLAIYIKYLYGCYGRRAVVIFSLLSLFIVWFVFNCLDIFAALAFIGALVFFDQKKFKHSGALLGAAVLIKFYPVVCLPVFLLKLPRTKAKSFLSYFGGVLLAGTLPFILISPSGFWDSVTYHLGRPLQIESGPAAVGFVLKLLGEPLKIFVSHKSFAVEYPGWKIVTAIATALLFFGLAWLYFWLKTAMARNNLALGSIAALLIYIIFFKVGSPQYLLPVWMVAFMVAEKMPSNEKWQLLGRLFLVSAVAYFTFSFYRQLIALNTFAGLLIVLRYILLAELLVWIIRKIKTSSFPI